MSGVVTVRHAVESDIAIVAAGLRASDLEAIAHTGRDPEVVMHYCFRHSSRRRTALLDGVVSAMWGCGGSLLGAYGEPWLFTTAAIERVPVTAMKLARRELAAMQRMFPVLTGILYRADGRACRFARRLGLDQIEDTGEAFIRYARVG